MTLTFGLVGRAAQADLPAGERSWVLPCSLLSAPTFHSLLTQSSEQNPTGSAHLKYRRSTGSKITPASRDHPFRMRETRVMQARASGHGPSAGVVGDRVQYVEPECHRSPRHLGIVGNDGDAVDPEAQGGRDVQRVGPAEDGIERDGFVD